MQQQPVRAFELVDQPADFVGGLDRHRLGIAGGGDEGQHHHIGVAVHEHVLEEHLGVLRVALRRVDEVALDVEDELLPGGSDLRAGELQVQGCCFRQVEESACLSSRGVGRVEGEQRARCATGRSQKRPLGATQTLRIRGSRLMRQAVGFDVRRPQRHRREFAVRGAVQLDGKAPAFGVGAGHGGPPVQSTINVGSWERRHPRGGPRLGSARSWRGRLDTDANRCALAVQPAGTDRDLGRGAGLTSRLRSSGQTPSTPGPCAPPDASAVPPPSWRRARVLHQALAVGGRDTRVETSANGRCAPPLQGSSASASRQRSNVPACGTSPACGFRSATYCRTAAPSVDRRLLPPLRFGQRRRRANEVREPFHSICRGGSAW